MVGKETSNDPVSSFACSNETQFTATTAKVRVFAHFAESEFPEGVTLDSTRHWLVISGENQEQSPPLPPSKTLGLDGIFCRKKGQAELCEAVLPDLIGSGLTGNDTCLINIATQQSVDNGIVPAAINRLYSRLTDTSGRPHRQPHVAAGGFSDTQSRDLLTQGESDIFHYQQSDGRGIFDHLSLHPVSSIEEASHCYHRALSRLEGGDPGDSCRHLVFIIELRAVNKLPTTTENEDAVRNRMYFYQLYCSPEKISNTAEVLESISRAMESVFTGHSSRNKCLLHRMLQRSVNSLLCQTAVLINFDECLQLKENIERIFHQADRLRRMIRRRPKKQRAVKYSTDVAMKKTLGREIESDLSSSEFSADTVIYRGPTNNIQQESGKCKDSGNSGEKKLHSQVRSRKGRSKEMKEHTESRQTTPGPHSAPTTTGRVRIPYSLSSPRGSRPSSAPSITRSPRSCARRSTRSNLSGNHQETWIDGPCSRETSKILENHNDQQLNLQNLSQDEQKHEMVSKWISEHAYAGFDKLPKRTRKRSKDKYHADYRLIGCESKPIMLTKFKTDDSPIHRHSGTESTCSDQMNDLNGHETRQTRLLHSRIHGEKTDSPLAVITDSSTTRNIPLAERTTTGSSTGTNDVSRVEIIEVPEPVEPVPTVDICLQVDEDDITACLDSMPPVLAQTINPRFLTMSSTTAENTFYRNIPRVDPWLQEELDLVRCSNVGYEYTEEPLFYDFMPNDLDVELLKNLQMEQCGEGTVTKQYLDHDLSLTNLRPDNIDRLQRFYQQLAEGSVSAIDFNLSQKRFDNPEEKRLHNENFLLCFPPDSSSAYQSDIYNTGEGHGLMRS